MRTLLILLLIATISPPPAGSGQSRVGVVLGRASGDNEVFAHPSSVGLFAAIAAGRAGARLDYTRLEDEQQHVALSCEVYWPEWSSCVEETFDVSGSMRLLTPSVFVSPLRIGRLSVHAGVGLSRPAVQARRRGRSTGREPWIPGSDPRFTNLASFLAEFSSPSFFGEALVGADLPVSFGASYRLHRLHLRECVTDVPYLPFCGEYSLNEIGIFIAGRL